MSKAKEPWNGRDWYVSFGEFPDGAAGKMQSSTGSSPPEAEWYSRSIRKLSAGARIFTRVPKAG